ncbi:MULTISPECIES: RsfA family transcriptional regulator [Bacillaceae]|uniref:RsfA family transcriptional regulator n=1 Tax=Bacillaceae TaxID=186817 RepID=UPI002FFE47C1
MKVRQDAWTDENDLLLAETVLRHVREGSTQLNAFEEVGDKLNRTSAACGFRWNAVVRHRYEKALALAKKQRKQRQRILGREQSGKKKLLYNPPVPTMTMTETLDTAPLQSEMQPETTVEIQDMTIEMASELYVNPVAHGYTPAPSALTMDTVITFLENFKHSNLQNDVLKIENERLKRELTDLKKQNEELSAKVKHLEENSETMQEDYETLMKIMNRARKLVLFEEEEERPATTFKMDRNGNLERVAE